jgi:protein SCO1/2
MPTNRKRASQTGKATRKKDADTAARAVMIGGALTVFLLGVGGLLLLTPSGSTRITAEQASSIGGPFTLTDQNGRLVSDQNFRGKYELLYFGYTFCPDVCPSTLNDIAGAMQKLGTKAADIQPVFITIDPRRDTPQVLKRYVAAFDPRLIGLTGTEQQIARVAREYRVYYAPHRTGPGPDDYTMDHSSVIYLIGPDGHFLTTIPADQQAASLAADIATHIS